MTETQDIVEEWTGEFSRHPMFGEGMTDAAIDEMWEAGSETYSDSSYATIRDMVIQTMQDEGILRPDCTVLDIGSGPGTFAIPMSKLCRSVICVDNSKGMLQRIVDSGVENISVRQMDCRHLTDDLKSDVAFSSLCPPMNCPAGIDRMGELGGRCVYVSSASQQDGLEGKIWRAIGMDYSYAGYDTHYPCRYLKSLGIDAELRIFSQPAEPPQPSKTVEERLISSISKYREVDDNLCRIIREIVSDSSEDGMVAQTDDRRMGMLTWSTGGNREREAVQIPNAVSGESHLIKY